MKHKTGPPGRPPDGQKDKTPKTAGTVLGVYRKRQPGDCQECTTFPVYHGGIGCQFPIFSAAGRNPNFPPYCNTSRCPGQHIRKRPKRVISPHNHTPNSTPEPPPDGPTERQITTLVDLSRRLGDRRFLLAKIALGLGGRKVPDLTRTEAGRLISHLIGEQTK